MTAAMTSDFDHLVSPGGQPFWKAMSSRMVFEAEELLGNVEIYIKMRSPTLGFPPVFVSSTIDFVASALLPTRVVAILGR
jgi:hypothetical protein